MTEHSARPLRLGTRASKLARWQAEHIAGRLRELGAKVEIVLLRTQGDAQQSGPIAAIGAQGVFTKELQRALLDCQIDLAVHSMKDLPTEKVDGLAVAAVPIREDHHDALVAPAALAPAPTTLADLPHGAHVGTGSARRRSQLLAARPDLKVSGIRGNVDTRLAKLDAGDFDAILLAAAGLRRLGLEDRISQLLPIEIMTPAPAQGALAIECRADDQPTLAALRPLEDAAARAAITAERTALRKLEGGCLAAMGAHARVDGEQLSLRAIVLSDDGSQHVWVEDQAPTYAAVDLGTAVATRLLDQGAAELLRPR
ncbi:Porphobilinogen deaminase [Posidoniimonas polymericola]|uniref:Porphobilinogen deaminase n=1 Tax=Posidoniimonas polymericola TaxID=2528002 RepID=A0A5C5YEQ4_9BACT|nr:hydroxymethylbilane synthase [Posidoniimonas polymericola]TWT73524.1 Porphobilinogen deaminase [Posidoniimonas polymericola]